MQTLKKMSIKVFRKKSIFQATNKWMNIISVFNNRISLKHHKYRFQIYSNCFRAEVGIQIMLEVLEELNTTKKIVTKRQVNLIKLLVKVEQFFTREIRFWIWQKSAKLFFCFLNEILKRFYMYS